VKPDLRRFFPHDIDDFQGGVVLDTALSGMDFFMR
jgi:hypothetical protein